MNSNDAEEALKALAVKFAAVTQRAESRLTEATDKTSQAAQLLARSTVQVQHVTTDMTRAALEQFRLAAANAIEAGARQSISGYNNALDASAQRMAEAAARLENRLDRSGAAQQATAWKSFASLVLACVCIVAATGYSVWQARKELQELKWKQELTAAQAAGKLVRCPEGGLCALVSNRWVRLDR